MKHSKWWLMGLGTVASIALAQNNSVLFASTQFRQLEEAQSMRDVILKDAPVKVEFLGQENAPFVSRLIAENKSGKPSVSLAGGLHGDFTALQAAAALDNVDDVLKDLNNVKFIPSMVSLGKLGTNNQKYIPWAQATYLMAAHKDALQYLPKGADLNDLTYEQLAEWGKNIEQATGRKRLGFPAGPNGLIHRYVQGYLLPSYTGSYVQKFKSPQAAEAWKDMQDIWKYTNPQSASYNFMQEPLLSGEVLVAWDHAARLKDAFTQRPNDFVAFPAPKGPAGRGYMPVIAGLGIPEGAPNRAGAVVTIKHLTKPETQAQTLRETGFFPVTRGNLPTNLPQGIKIMAEAVEKQSGEGSIAALLPVGLGAQDGEFSKVYVDAFQRMIIRNQNIQSSLNTQARQLQRVLDTSKAACWAPDPVAKDTCKVQ
ncbi:ABC transporter substrate-binding protein [Deinococcus peraridilitoris]|uniref:ABC-type sugar transport system, periplasmic component n=1 Tax=Deinococcus peraridilitoris (strain DSM 19664 / LMG 22246 / CIP 109416 / KR-200) TaxID=937777 RepID=L0A9K6_DEIPD|nr:ABC transporter substrate-binding protein [Deinococcus peraridilitoris]AFZ69735.1 ABC-type sugar transport system, periplasmic component [Deinococcus peraridilitoris DSM 19664]